MKRPILFASCILVMYAVSLAGPAITSPANCAEALSQLTNLSWDRKTPLQAEGGLCSTDKPHFALSFADSPILEDLPPTQLDSAPPAAPENIYTVPTPGPLILTGIGIGIASIGCLHRKKRL